MQRLARRRFSGPRRLEWLVLAISLGFVACGVLAWPSDPDLGVSLLAFFGSCGAAAAATIVRKRRFARLRPLKVEIVGGVPIRPSRVFVAGLGLWLLGLGLVLLAYGSSPSVGERICLWSLIVVGALLLIGLLTGLLPAGFLQFDPHGLTIGRHRDAFTLPWDSIASVAPIEYHDNPALLLRLHDPASVLVRPPHARARVLSALHTNLRWFDAHVMIFSSQYGVDLPLLVAAIERYVADSQARVGLAVRRLPEGPA